MNLSESHVRFKIDILLRRAGWILNGDSRDNVMPEYEVKSTDTKPDAFGNEVTVTTRKYADYVLLDDNGFPILVLEVKRENKNPLDGKEQARDYAEALNVRYVLLSNGDVHYYWDRESGNPSPVRVFPTLTSLLDREEYKPNPDTLINEFVEEDYVAKTQKPDYVTDPRFIDESQRADFLKDNGLMLLRHYQLNAVKSIQKSVADGNKRFLFEMATGTGKTLIAAAVIKLFLRTSNAKRVLFLVDRIELEDQAEKAFTRYLKNDYQTAVYKRARNNWNNAEIVVSTVQSLNDKYHQLFAPTDFDLVISDESHRSIGGNARAVFEYFTGYKLGLTATPKDYLKNIKNIDERDPREIERRQLLDTYETFGCSSGEPTFRYSLIDGVDEGFLINPIVADARTEITTQLLSDEGYSIQVENEETGELEDAIFSHRDFERKFYSVKTNRVFCETFIQNALRDPMSGEIGKTIIFCVSQKHAGRIAQTLNEIAHEQFPHKYNSDFAVQVTSSITNAQQFTINFANNNLNGHTKWLDSYKSGKTRICVTVGMMTTGYDCQDILNLCLMRPIFSPTDFVQIKGRGTRTFTFQYSERNTIGEMQTRKEKKEAFKILDFFANFEYFEEKFNYDEELKIPTIGKTRRPIDPPVSIEGYDSERKDPLAEYKIKDPKGKFWKIDFKYWGHFTEKLKDHEVVEQFVLEGNMKAAEDYVRKHVFDKPDEYFTLDRLRKSVQVDRRLSLRELLEKAFNLIPHFKTKAEKLDEECDTFISIYKPDPEQVLHIRNFLRAYIIDGTVREIVESQEYGRFATNPIRDDFKALEPQWRERIPIYVNDYISLNEFNQV
ncbi:MAG: DEAD/DEAH box helicase family protein [Candidatus Marinimicrobia bacterium]|nr:DEAD/DEAH box helicase family protein [Candidatus Neomarinimicrobiota bacterium]